MCTSGQPFGLPPFAPPRSIAAIDSIIGMQGLTCLLGLSPARHFALRLLTICPITQPILLAKSPRTPGSPIRSKLTLPRTSRQPHRRSRSPITCSTPSACRNARSGRRPALPVARSANRPGSLVGSRGALLGARGRPPARKTGPGPLSHGPDRTGGAGLLPELEPRASV